MKDRWRFVHIARLDSRFWSQVWLARTRNRFMAHPQREEHFPQALQFISVFKSLQLGITYSAVGCGSVRIELGASYILCHNQDCLLIRGPSLMPHTRISCSCLLSYFNDYPKFKFWRKFPSCTCRAEGCRISHSFLCIHPPGSEYCRFV